MRTHVWSRYGRSITCGLLLLGQAACMTSPRPVEAPAPLLTSQPPKRIWVSLANGDQLVIEGPRVYGDSLLGFTQKGETKEEVWLPLSDLKEVKVRHLSGSRSAVLGGLIVAGVIGGVILIRGSAGEKDTGCINEGEPCEQA